MGRTGTTNTMGIHNNFKEIDATHPFEIDIWKISSHANRIPSTQLVRRVNDRYDRRVSA